VVLFAGWFHGSHGNNLKLSGQSFAVNNAGFIGIPSLAWSGHLIHVALPAARGHRVDWSNLWNRLPHPDGLRGLATLDWTTYASDLDSPGHSFGIADQASGTGILSFTGGQIAESTGSLELTDIAHHHLALGIVCLCLGHLTRSIEWRLIPPKSPHFILGISLAILGTLSTFYAAHLEIYPAYAYLQRDLVTMSALYTHHSYIGGFFVLGGFAHGGIYFVRDYVPGSNDHWLGHLLLRQRHVIISHLSAITLFLGFHTLGIYCHNDVMQSFGAPEYEIAICPVFAIWVQAAHGSGLGSRITTGDFLVHHAIALGLHVTVLILLKAAFSARSSRLMPDKVAFGYGFPCDGPGRGGT